MSLARCIAFLTILIAVFSVLSPHFLSWSNAENILSASAVIGLLALGSTFVIASGAIDLSVASVMALSGTVCAALLTNITDIPPLLAVAVCVATGGLCGLATGTLANITGAPSFVVTLGMLSVARALSYIIADGMPIYGLPESVTALGQGEIFGLPGAIVLLTVGAAVAVILLRFRRFGTHILVYGDNPFAAAAMGIKIQWLRITIFTVCGAYSGLSGFVFMARTNAGDPTAGQNYELVAITAVILGGAKLFGGDASALGTLLGVLCLSTLQNGLNLLAVSSYYQVLFVGLVLISAAFLERLGEKT